MHKPGLVSAQHADGRIRTYLCWPEDTVSVNDTLITSYEPAEATGTWTVGIATVVKADASLGEGVRPYLLHIPWVFLLDRSDAASLVKSSFNESIRLINEWPKF